MNRNADSAIDLSDEELNSLMTVKWKNPKKQGRWEEDSPPEFNWFKEKAVSALDDSISNWRVVYAFTKVYRARCNLFHGDKHVTDEKDLLLVETSCELLRRFLEYAQAKHIGIADNIPSMQASISERDRPGEMHV